ncbi:DUF3999 domain-containing protein [Pseudoxanthomonas winnipegensis]|uniref:DUF3999 domain-containing protein n=1 Tax=Pseudoxanthomonas winnipegensis TaxID=2480810 RepID=UPI00257635C9|nr:DUF3999 domain-containing protein [Pseudoxanthomonas winnipegensis]WJI15911.1 DUF3999 domain-containing protein [Pseudoxanthomonas winnipegensis]
MKRWLILALLLAPAAPAADLRGDYARQWPLQLSPADAGAYRVALDATVYRTAIDASLRDVQPLDSGGQPLPAALLDALASQAQPRLQPLPVFALPSVPASGQSTDVVAERDASGAVQRIQTRTTMAADGLPAWLLDASGVHEPLRALRLDWPATQAQAQVRVEVSDDLRDWTTVQAATTLVQVDNGTQRLAQRRIPLNLRARYLRLTALTPGLVAISAAQAELAPQRTQAPLQWLELDGAAREGGYVFTTSGRFPVELADVALAGNDAIQWRLQSRDADDAPWRERAGPWLAFRVGGDAASRSQPQSFELTRDRQWRLLPADGATVSVPPRLRLGWRAEELVFVASGQPPYILVAGSARAARANAPLQSLLDSLQRAGGPQWQPAPATLAAPSDLAGQAALQPARDWKTWLLWGLLVLGALVVGGFALSLLRGAFGAKPD